MKKKILKLITTTITAVFFTNTVVFPASSVYTINVPDEYGKVIQRYKAPNVGTKDEGRETRDEKIIIHVQDAHTNTEAQENLARIICSLIPQLQKSEVRSRKLDEENGLARIEPSASISGHGFQDGNGVINQRQSASKGRIPFVGIEGATREYDLKELRDLPFKVAREKVGREFMKEGKFIGSEYASMISDEDFTLFGLEDKDLLKEDFQAFYAVTAQQDELEEKIKQIEEQLAQLKQDIFNSRLKAFDLKAHQYETQQASFIEYLGYLYATFEKLGIEIWPYLSLMQFREAFAVNQNINFDELEKEIETLAKKLIETKDQRPKTTDFRVIASNSEAISRLKGQSAGQEAPADAKALAGKQSSKHKAESGKDEKITPCAMRHALCVNQDIKEHFKKYKAKDISQNEIVTFLVSEAHRYNIPLEPYPHLALFKTYQKKYSSIDMGKLIKEVREANHHVRLTLAKNTDEQLLINLVDRVGKLKRLLTLHAVNEDVEVFRDDRQNLNFEFIARGIDKLRLKYGQQTTDHRPQTVAQSNELDNTLKLVDEFYTKAEERDVVMLDNLLKKMDANDQHVGVLVAGGYHSSGLTRHMRARGLSYITVRPEINDITADTSFNNRMLGHVAPISPEYRSSFQASQITASFSELNPAEFGKFLDEAGILIRGQYLLDNIQTPEEILKKIALMRKKYIKNNEMMRLADALEGIVQALEPIVVKAMQEKKTVEEQVEMIMQAFGKKVSEDSTLQESIGKTVKNQESLAEYLSNVKDTFYELLRLEESDEEIGLHTGDETDHMSILVRHVPDRSGMAPPLTLLHREGNPGQEYLMKRIQEIVESYEDIDEMMRAVFLEFCQLKEEEMDFAQDWLYERCSWELRNIVTTVQLHKRPDPALLEYMRELILDTAILILFFQIPGDRTTDNLLFFLEYIDTEMVVRVMPDGRVLIPSRVEPYELTDEEIDINGLRDLVDFVQKARDKGRLSRIFNGQLYKRYHRIGLSDREIAEYRDNLIDKLINESGYDIVRKRSKLGRKRILAHSRKGFTPQGTGVWVGEAIVRDLMRDGDDGLDFYVETLLEEAQHFGIKKGRHEPLTNILDFKKYIEHGYEWLRKLALQAKGLDDEIEAKKQMLEKKRIVSLENIDKIAPREFSINPYPQREGEASDEILTKRIQSIIESEMDPEDMQKEIFKAVIRVDEMTPVQEEICQRLNRVLKRQVKWLKRSFEMRYIERLREAVTRAASDILHIEQRGNRTMGNLLIFMNYIGRNIALRITHDNRALVPGRIDPPYELTQDEIVEHDVQPLMDFIKNAKDEELLKNIFDEKLYERYHRIGFSDDDIYGKGGLRDTLIHKLRNEASIDLIRGRASFCTGLYTMHPRRGFSTPGRGPGIWVGELTVRALMEEGQKGIEFFAQLMLEDAQHFLSEPSIYPIHEKLIKRDDGSTNYGTVIEHDDDFLEMLENLTKDIENTIRRKSVELTDAEIARLKADGKELTEDEINEIKKEYIALSELEVVENRVLERLKEIQERNGKMQNADTDHISIDPMPLSPVSPPMDKMFYSTDTHRALAQSSVSGTNDEQMDDDFLKTLIDVLGTQTDPSAIPLFSAGDIFAQNDKKADAFIQTLKQYGITPVFVIDDAIPRDIQNTIQSIGESAGITCCTTDEYDPWIYGKHFVLYVGTTKENVPAIIVQKKERVSVLLGNNLNTTQKMLTVLYGDFLRIVMMAQGLTKKQEPIKRPITLTLYNIFPNLDNLNERSVAFLNKVDEILSRRVFKTAA